MAGILLGILLVSHHEWLKQKHVKTTVTAEQSHGNNDHILHTSKTRFINGFGINGWFYIFSK
jgi:hypothetical protein